MGLSYDYLFTGNTSIGVSGNSHNIMKTWKQIEKEFDEEFHKRIWSIVKQVNPSSYAEAEMTGQLDGEGPQIYGEMKEYFKDTLDEYVRELIGEEELLVTDGDCPACGWHISAHGGEDGEKCPIIERNNFRRELLQQHEVQMGEKDD